MKAVIHWPNLGLKNTLLLRSIEIELITWKREDNKVNNDVLDGLFRPKSVAVIGASSQPGKIGYTVVANLINGKYQGKIYPINPNAGELLGLKVYPSILEVPGEVDAAIITVPAKLVKDVTVDCGKKGVKGLIVIASGFSEVGNRELEQELVDTAHQY